VTDVAGALLAVRAGAGAVMVDTGTIDMLAAVTDALRAEGFREHVVIGFGGGVTREFLTAAYLAGADVVDVGRAILDAPLWDLRVGVGSCRLIACAACSSTYRHASSRAAAGWTACCSPRSHPGLHLRAPSWRPR